MSRALPEPAVARVGRVLDWGFDDDEAFTVTEHARGKLEPKRAAQLGATLSDALTRPTSSASCIAISSRRTCAAALRDKLRLVAARIRSGW